MSCDPGSVSVVGNATDDEVAAVMAALSLLFSRGEDKRSTVVRQKSWSRAYRLRARGPFPQTG